MPKPCDHQGRSVKVPTKPKLASLYRRGPESDGGKFIPDAFRCRDCDALVDRDD